MSKVKRYFRPTLRTGLHWEVEESCEDMVLATDYDDLLADARRLYEELVPFATYEEGARLAEDFRERWLQEDT